MSPREIFQGLEHWFTRNSAVELVDQDIFFLAGEAALAAAAVFAVVAALAVIVILFQAITGQLQ